MSKPKIYPVYLRIIVLLGLALWSLAGHSGSLENPSYSVYTPQIEKPSHDLAIERMLASMEAPDFYLATINKQLLLEKHAYPYLASVYEDIIKQFDQQKTTSLLIPIYKNYFTVDDAIAAEHYFSSALGIKVTHLIKSNLSQHQILKQLSDKELVLEQEYAHMRFKDPGIWLNISADFKLAANTIIDTMMTEIMASYD